MARGEEGYGFKAPDQDEEVVEEVVEVVEETEAPKGPVFDRGKDGRVVDTNK